MTDDATPRFDVPMEDAADDLRLFEIIAIEKHYGCKFSHMGEGQQLAGVVWALHAREAKRDGQAAPRWHEIEQLSTAEIQAMFPERDPDPDSDQGKESTD